MKVYNLNKNPGWVVIGGVALLLYAASDLLVPGKGRQSVDGLTGAGHLKVERSDGVQHQDTPKDCSGCLGDSD